MDEVEPVRWAGTDFEVRAVGFADGLDVGVSEKEGSESAPGLGAPASAEVRKAESGWGLGIPLSFNFQNFQKFPQAVSHTI